MRKLVFLNNTSFTITNPLPGMDDPEFTSYGLADVTAKTGMDPNYFFPETEGPFTVATITHKDVPDTFEIVNVLGMSTEEGYEGLVFIRGSGGTMPVAWPAGAVVEFRITASMLIQLMGNNSTDFVNFAASFNGGDNFIDWDDFGDRQMLPASFALGGLPIAPARGISDSIGVPMAQQVEGVGYSHMLELAVAPDFDPNRQYYPGEYARQTVSPFHTFCRGRGRSYAQRPSLGDHPWVRFNPAGDSNILAFPRIGINMGQSNGTRFYPTEIGFICEEYTATTEPTVSIVEVDYYGTPVPGSTLLAPTALSDLAAHTRKMLVGNTLTKGIYGMHFILNGVGAGGTCRGRFYWKGLFVHAPGGDVPGGGYFSEESTIDGLPASVF